MRGCRAAHPRAGLSAAQRRLLLRRARAAGVCRIAPVSAPRDRLHFEARELRSNTAFVDAARRCAVAAPAEAHRLLAGHPVLLLSVVEDLRRRSNHTQPAAPPIDEQTMPAARLEPSQVMVRCCHSPGLTTSPSDHRRRCRDRPGAFRRASEPSSRRSMVYPRLPFIRPRRANRGRRAGPSTRNQSRVNWIVALEERDRPAASRKLSPDLCAKPTLPVTSSSSDRCPPTRRSLSRDGVTKIPGLVGLRSAGGGSFGRLGVRSPLRRLEREVRDESRAADRARRRRRGRQPAWKPA